MKLSDFTPCSPCSSRFPTNLFLVDLLLSVVLIMGISSFPSSGEKSSGHLCIMGVFLPLFPPEIQEGGQSLHVFSAVFSPTSFTCFRPDGSLLVGSCSWKGRSDQNSHHWGALTFTLCCVSVGVGVKSSPGDTVAPALSCVVPRPGGCPGLGGACDPPYPSCHLALGTLCRGRPCSPAEGTEHCASYLRTSIVSTRGLKISILSVIFFFLQKLYFWELNWQWLVKSSSWKVSVYHPPWL